MDTQSLAVVMTVLDRHRWSSMGASTVRCECGAVMSGTASLTQFPADHAFREHIAHEVLAALDRGNDLTIEREQP